MRNPTVWLLLVILGLVAAGLLERRSRVNENTRLINRVEEIAAESHKAFCGLKADYRRQVDRMVLLLRENAGDPIMVLGLSIPRDQIRNELRIRQETLDSISIVTCN